MDAALFSSPTWFYIDSDGQERGPFGAEDMLGWYSDGYFPAQLLVRRNIYSNFTKLSSLALGNAVQPVVNIHPAAKPQKHYFVSRTEDFMSKDPFGTTKAGKTESLKISGTETEVEYIENEIKEEYGTETEVEYIENGIKEECLKLEIKEECVKSEIKDECLNPKMLKEFIKSEINVECTKFVVKEEYLNTGNEREVLDSLQNDSFSLIANAKTEILHRMSGVKIKEELEEKIDRDLVMGCPQLDQVKHERSELIQHCLGILGNREYGIQEASKRNVRSYQENVENLGISTREKTNEFQSQTVKESSIREQRKTPTQYPRKKPLHKSLKTSLRQIRKKPLHEPIKTPLLENLKSPLRDLRKTPSREPRKKSLLESIKTSLHEPIKTPLLKTTKSPLRDLRKIPLHEPKKIQLTVEPRKMPLFEPRDDTLLRDLRKTPLRVEPTKMLLGEPRGTLLHDLKKIPFCEPKKIPFCEPKKIPFCEPKKIPFCEPKKIPIPVEPKIPLREPKKILNREKRNSLLGKQRKKTGDCVDNSIATSKVFRIKKQRNVKTVYLRVQNHLPSPFTGTKELDSDSKFVQIPMKMKDGKYRYCVVKFGNEQECTKAKYKLPINTLLKEQMFYVYFVADYDEK